MRDINEIYKVLKARAEASDHWMTNYPDDHDELIRNVEIYILIWMFESESYFNEMKKIYLKDR